MSQMRGYILTEKNKLLFGISLILTLASAAYTHSGYKGYRSITYYGWPFPWLIESEIVSRDAISSSHGFMGIEFVLTTFYWYGVVYLAFSILLKWYPERLEKYIDVIDWRYRFPDERLKTDATQQTTRVKPESEYTPGEREYASEQYKWRGLAYLVYGFFEFAIRDFTKTITLTPSNSKGYYRRGYAYSWLKNYLKAIEDYSVAIKMEPDNLRYHLLRGKAYLNSGKVTEAKADLQKVLELDQDNQEAKRLLNDTHD